MPRIDQRVRSVVSEQLGIPVEQIGDDDRFVDDLGADSLDLVEIIIALEEEFNMEIPDEDAQQITTVREAVEYIQSHQRYMQIPLCLPTNLTLSNPHLPEVRNHYRAVCKMSLTDVLPFPYPLSVGTDICHVPRIQRILSNENEEHVTRFSRKIFSPTELPGFQERYQAVLRLRRTMPARAQIEENQTDDHGSGVDNDVRCDKYERELLGFSKWVAGRFAAKEAAMKALSPHRLGWHQAEVLTLPGRKKPVLVVHAPPPLKAESKENGDGGHQMLRKQVAQLSISHDGDYATATVLAVNSFGADFGTLESEIYFIDHIKQDILDHRNDKEYDVIYLSPLPESRHNFRIQVHDFVNLDFDNPSKWSSAFLTAYGHIKEPSPYGEPFLVTRILIPEQAGNSTNALEPRISYFS
ncbi:uncharacterized protein N7515_006185 [Penicillium bovifimosum]|uniref:Acyl carrier protein n=1 Tax=Penicillium bovifimosum TaxID=126998 RepID=A0A9W9L0I1_9EURO|nr:uncharacterized protein N7515_006185 [Penicillium bovifimosum]KAJ5130146.1 hypothetical protein N7515_006185 [Penicillium bovifimosum]